MIADVLMIDMKRKYRYSILTYNFGGYEIMREILHPKDDVEYIYVTDDRNLTSKTWKIVIDESLDGLSPFDKCYSVRFNPFKYVSSDICIRVDGSIVVDGNADKLIEEFEKGNYDMACVAHRFRDNMIDEYNAWIRLREYPQQQAEKCLSYIERNGYSLNTKGMFECCLCVQRRSEICEEINKKTFEVLKELGDGEKIERQDQTIFTFVVYNWFRDKVSVLPLSALVVHSSMFKICAHNKKDSIIYDMLNPNLYGGYFMNQMTKFLVLG